MKDLKDYLKKVDMIDLYITKNICQIVKNKKELEYIKSNIFLLGFNNKNRKNSLRVLLDNQEYKIIKDLVLYDNSILNFKNSNKTNLFQMIITIDYFYDFINKLLENSDYDFMIKIIINKDANNLDSIDLLISLITSNLEYLITNINKLDELKDYNKIKLIIKNIYSLDKEDSILLITRLCSNIKNENILLDILKFINPKNIDIYPDKIKFTCIDYLFLNENIKVLEYLVPKINYIYFMNSDTNFLFNFVDRIEEISIEKSISIDKLIEIVFEILSKSNIKKIKNIKNESILFVLISKLKIDSGVVKKYLGYFNIWDENIDGQSIGSLLKIESENKKSNTKSNNFNDIPINFSKLLEYTNIGVFSSDIIHNMIYTICLLKKFNNVTIPYFVQDKQYNQLQRNLLELSNNDNFVMSFLKNYFYRFNSFVPFIIIWKNFNNYYLDLNLINFLQSNKDIEYTYVRLSISITNEFNDNIRHANILVIDNKNKIIERFEPYGEIDFYNSNDINDMINEKIAKQLKYKYKFVQPYPGFQTRSDELDKYNKVYGDPSGFCLAWCILYFEIKLLLSEKKIDANPIDYINWYIINKFEEDFPEIKDLGNKYMNFIRFYAKRLDNEKNKLIKSIGIEPELLYHTELSKSDIKMIVKKLNKELYDIFNI